MTTVWCGLFLVSVVCVCLTVKVLAVVARVYTVRWLGLLMPVVKVVSGSRYDYYRVWV